MEEKEWGVVQTEGKVEEHEYGERAAMEGERHGEEEVERLG